MFEIFDEYLDMFGDDAIYFDNLIGLYDHFEVVDNDGISLTLNYADVFIIAELHNNNVKYHLKCYVGNKYETKYCFNNLKKMNSKLNKMNRFITNHSSCLIELPDLPIED